MKIYVSIRRRGRIEGNSLIELIPNRIRPYRRRRRRPIPTYKPGTNNGPSAGLRRRRRSTTKPAFGWIGRVRPTGAEVQVQ